MSNARTFMNCVFISSQSDCLPFSKLTCRQRIFCVNEKSCHQIDLKTQNTMHLSHSSSGFRNLSEWGPMTRETCGPARRHLFFYSAPPNPESATGITIFYFTQGNENTHDNIFPSMHVLCLSSLRVD